MSFRISRLVGALGLLFVLAWPVLANASVTIVIDGTAYPAQWQPSSDLLQRLHLEQTLRAQHMQGHLDGIAGSWLRASRIDGQWQGLVAMNGRHYVIDSSATTDRFGNLTLTAQLPSNASGQCATVMPSGAVKTAKIADLTTAAVSLGTLCSSTVDGVCLLPELEIVFDLEFQQRFPSSYADRAVSLLNMVDGYYQNDLQMRFDAITIEFPSTELFSSTTDSSQFLDAIATQKNQNSLPFIKNKRAILHVVTGRTFDGSTVGIANIGTLCNQFDNVGASQFATTMGLTALVIAHELGHNLGALHDTEDNSCSDGYIMAPTLSATATDFSSCSIQEMTATIDALSSLDGCFEYPVDASIVEHPGNPTTAGANENFTLAFDVGETHAGVAPSQLTLTGSLSGAAGSFSAATVNGNACAVAAASQTFTCNDPPPPGGQTDLLEATAQVNGSGAMTVHVHVAPVGGGGASLDDVVSSNDDAAASVQAGTPPNAPAMLTAVAAAGGALEIDLGWQDNSSNEDGFRVERRVGTGAYQLIATLAPNVTSYADSAVSSGVSYTYQVTAFDSGGTSAPATSVPVQIAASSSGGGGGAYGLELVPLLLLALKRRRRRR